MLVSLIEANYNNAKEKYLKYAPRKISKKKKNVHVHDI